MMQKPPGNNQYTYTELVAMIKEVTGKAYSSGQIQRLVRKQVLKKIVPPGGVQGFYESTAADAYIAALKEFYQVEESK